MADANYLPTHAARFALVRRTESAYGFIRSALRATILLVFCLLTPYSSAQDKAFAWRVWIERQDTTGEPVPVLQADTSYVLHAQIVAVHDPKALAQQIGGAEFLRTVNEDLTANAKAAMQEGRRQLRRKMILIHDETYFRMPDEVMSSMWVEVRHIVRPLNNGDPRKNQAVSNTVTFPLVTQKPIPVGRAYLALAVFDDQLNQVHDNISLAACTEPLAKTQPGCKGYSPIAFGLMGRDPFRDSAGNDPEHLRGMPDAAFTFIQQEQNKPVVGVLRVNRIGPEILDNEKPLVWHLQRQSMASIIANLREIPERLTSRRDVARETGESLYRMLFPRDAEAARARFEQFVKAVAPYPQPFSLKSPASIAVRFVGPARLLQSPRAYPLSAMWVPVYRSPPTGITFTSEEANGLFIGHHFRIELPLERQQTQWTHPCISNWVFVGPPLGLGDEALKLARSQLDSQYLHTALNGKDETIVLGNAKRRFPMTSMRTARSLMTSRDDVQRPSAISFVSHHARNRLYFTDQANDGFWATDVSVRFKQPSFAILNGCTTGSGNPVEAQFLDQLNSSGFEAMIATVAPVNGDLAGRFTACMIAILDRQSGRMTLADFFQQTRYCVYEKTDDTEILKYVFLGNSRLEICAPGEE